MKLAGRRFAIVLAAVAVTTGLLAALMVQREMKAGNYDGGTPTPVLVAAAAIEAGAIIEPEAVAQLVTTIDVPSSFVPPDALSDAADVAGLRAVSAIPVGGYVTRGAFMDKREGQYFRLRRGERAITVDASTAPDGVEPAAGSIVDLLVSGIGGAQDTGVLVAGAEVLSVSDADPARSEVEEEAVEEQGPPTGPTSRLTIRVSAAQLPSIVRADVFARELRAVIR